MCKDSVHILSPLITIKLRFIWLLDNMKEFFYLELHSASFPVQFGHGLNNWRIQLHICWCVYVPSLHICRFISIPLLHSWWFIFNGSCCSHARWRKNVVGNTDVIDTLVIISCKDKSTEYEDDIGTFSLFLGLTFISCSFLMKNCSRTMGKKKS